MMVHMAGLVQAQSRSSDLKRHHFVGGVPVCYDFWVKALGVSKDKYGKIKKLADNESTIHCTERASNRKTTTLENMKCLGFWRYYFATFCQTPDEEMYLWPTGQTFTRIYDSHFNSYCTRGWPGAAVPSHTTMVRARDDDEFNNVKRRAKHFHLKCDLCSLLGEQRMHGCMSKEEKATNDKEQLDHDKQVKLWHNAEVALTCQARHTPDEIQVFKLDDTNALELPSVGDREPKSIAGMYKVKYVPCLLEDVNANKKKYIYHLKGTFKKGGNRFCTTLYHGIMAAKTSGTPSSRARTC